MNSVSIKYKSLFYSLSIHLLLALALLVAYMREENRHDAYTLVDLQSIHLCAPVSMSVAESTAAEQKQFKAQALPERQISKSQPIQTKDKAENLPVEKKIAEVAQAMPIKKVLKPITPVVQQESAKPVESIENEVMKKMETALQTEQEMQAKAVPEVMAVTEPRLSVEAQYMRDHIALINALIKKNLTYPRLAKKRGLQGKALVSFTLNMEGEVLDIEALGDVSSILKKSAIKTIQRASVDFPHPSEVLALRIPIVYKLH